MGEAGRNGLMPDDAMRESAEIQGPARRKNAGRAALHRVKVDPNGALKLPPDFIKTLGVKAGETLEVAEDRGRLEIRPNIHSLARVYIEPTSRCNLACRTCIRNTWNEPLGDMSPKTFDKIVAHLRCFDHLESVMFGGFGEPTAHPEILDMLGAVKKLGVASELTTNGTFLDERMIRGLFKARLNRLWVSFDGTDEASHESIRLGARFGRVVENLRTLQTINARSRHKIAVGLSFVVLRRNIGDLKNVDELARSVGADKVLVSNVLPYSEEMEKEMLCLLTLTTETFSFASAKTEVSLPRLDVSPLTRETIYHLLQGYQNLTMMGNKIFAETRSCRFVRDRATFVRWDGQVSPCLGLLHEHKTYLYGNERRIRPYFVGDIRTKSLYALWNSREYRKFRERVRDFDFSPCHICGGCNLLETNDEDCFGNIYPVCGGCLWAQGVIQCP
jgi:MoaA/NifB/PqqE/SkfB family radical SAM enzyme